MFHRLSLEKKQIITIPMDFIIILFIIRVNKPLMGLQAQEKEFKIGQSVIIYFTDFTLMVNQKIRPNLSAIPYLSIQVQAV
ncbi:hypothetical protein D3C87_2062920 [compost metagenome]